MTLEIHDSATKTQQVFEPRVPGKVGIYLCGATVQGSPHIGHLRSALAFDVLARWLSRSGYQVTTVRNVTDIDDKILAKSAEADWEWWAWAYRFEQEFSAAYRALGVLPPTYEPRATGHITDMISLIGTIIDRGHAYAGNPGNVYFDVESLPDYGSLTRQDLRNMTVDEDDVETDKRNPHDFALWKAPKDGEPETAAWDSPWGRGRPGWHIECSAMAGRYLGDAFDIHGGGIDLRFPHHENEQAQSHAAGRSFAKYWMHNAWVTVDGEKMSKSLGNSLIVSEILKNVSAPVLRFALTTVHYRSTVAYSPVTLSEASANWERISGFLARAAETVGEADSDAVAGLGAGELPVEFREAMDDDLNVSAAMAVIHDHITRANVALSARDDLAVAEAQVTIRAMLDVLGLDPRSQQWRDAGGNSHDEALSVLVQDVLDRRAQARADKNWELADSLRDTLTEAGINVEDGADGVRWHVKENS
ncbi:cysteine--tRNA ligase [Flaviflexus equikiangi]|uniref:Cysteine--tRNA ligase n=1 Tax=Flaviflexus equikiangi TaxID=2758573 RepID=A0ABS2TCM1_9ACTO|nr:cysteine--tRNA ligase [Flaviflexus equikiangi]MBM9432394.1 cysteine--tRNA ligase [Flaviflexus equikiangi]